jgi:hypothetical protein
MKQDETIESVLSHYDDKNRKGFDLISISSELGTLPDSERQRDEFRYESVACSLVVSENSPWEGHAYAPQLTYKDANGNPVYFPSLNLIDEKMIRYWEKRKEETFNPILKEHYAHLVCDFKPKVCGINVSFEYIKTVIDNSVTIARENYVSYSFLSVQYLRRAFIFALKYNYSLDSVKQVFVDYEKYNSFPDSSAGLWGVYFSLMLDNPKSFTEDEASFLVGKHEERFNRLINQNNADPFVVESQGILLAKYYQKNQKKDSIEEVLHLIEKCYKINFRKITSLQQMGQLQRLLSLYNEFGLKDDKQRLCIEIQKQSELAKRELVPESIKLEYPHGFVENAMKNLTSGTELQQLQKMMFYFLPSKSDQEEYVKKDAAQAPFYYSIPVLLMDENGRPFSRVGSIDNDIDGLVVLRTSQYMQIQSDMLDKIIKRQKKARVLTKNKIMDHLRACPLFHNDRIPILEIGIKRLFEEDYVEASHLLIPQIEHAIANLVEESGESILKSQNGGKSFQIRNLDDLLRTNAVKETITEDGAYYLRILLTDPRGWNIRNNICHGLSTPNSFNSMVGNRLLHVLIMLGFIRR